MRVWDVATGRQHRVFDWGVGRVQCLAIASDGMTATAGGSTNMIVVWDLDKGIRIPVWICRVRLPAPLNFACRRRHFFRDKCLEQHLAERRSRRVGIVVYSHHIHDPGSH